MLLALQHCLKCKSVLCKEGILPFPPSHLCANRTEAYHCAHVIVSNEGRVCIDILDCLLGCGDVAITFKAEVLEYLAS